MIPGKGKSHQKLICKSCHLYQKPQSHLYDDPGRCSLGRILPVKKNQCDKYVEIIQGSHGGARPGAGRPRKKQKKQVRAFALSAQVVDFINQYARTSGLSKSETVESIIKSCF
jgi:hypothetical protein